MSEPLTFTAFVDFVVGRLYELGSDPGGRLHSVPGIAHELGDAVPDGWCQQAAEVLDERGLATVAVGFGGEADATITGAGRLYVESGAAQAPDVVTGYHDKPLAYLRAIAARPGATNAASGLLDSSEPPCLVTPSSHEWALRNGRFLEIVFGAFDEDADWPVIRVMQRRLLQAGEAIDMTQAAHDLPREFGYRGGMQPDERVVLSVFALRYVESAAPLLDDFLRLVRLAVDRYLGTSEPVVVNRGDLTEVLGLSEARAVRLSRLLIAGTAGIGFLGGGTADLDTWERSVYEPALAPLVEADTVDALLAKAGEAFVRFTAPIAAEPYPGLDLVGVETPKPVFLVHGHNQTFKHQVARFLEKTASGVTILDEAPSLGRTLIEKFEDHAAEAGYAVVLLTGDDEGRAKGDTDLQPRARQNAILELGFFVAKLGRKRVTMLYEANVEPPSDIAGVAYVALDSDGAWKMKLAREMHAAGVTIDLEKALTA